MCRFALYLGAEVKISSLVTDPVNSIIHQSFHSHLRSEPLNGDGFGVAWYPADRRETPAVFRSTTPAWSDENLKELARVTATRCILAHVRAATPGQPVARLNCHPFAHGPLTMMHNGNWAGFREIRQPLLPRLSSEAFHAVRGSTDSEHIFALFLDALEAVPRAVDRTEQLATAVEHTIARVEALGREAGIDEPSFLNIAVSDGERAVVTRYATGNAPAHTLHVNTGSLYTCGEGLCRLRDDGPDPSAVVVASEPLDDDDRWRSVPAGHLLSITPELDMRVRRIDAG